MGFILRLNHSAKMLHVYTSHPELSPRGGWGFVVPRVLLL